APAAWLLYFLAILTKESAVVLPALLFLDGMAGEAGSLLARIVALLRRRALFYASFAIPLAATFALRMAVLKGFLISKMAGFFELENPLVSVSAFQRAGNASLVLLRNVGRIDFPALLSADESAWQLPLPPP